jgi:hypothetical protein
VFLAEPEELLRLFLVGFGVGFDFGVGFAFDVYFGFDAGFASWFGFCFCSRFQLPTYQITQLPNLSQFLCYPLLLRVSKVWIWFCLSFQITHLPNYPICLNSSVAPVPLRFKGFAFACNLPNYQITQLPNLSAPVPLRFKGLDFGFGCALPSRVISGKILLRVAPWSPN